MKLKFVEKRPEVAGVETLVFEAPQGLSWQAGQYLHYNLPHPEADDRGVERWFTISAPPFTGRPTITTRMDGAPQSSFKRALGQLAPGQEVEAGEPEGDFVLEGDGPFLLVAGGIGVTPYHAMLAQAAHDGVMPKIHLLYAGRSMEGLPFRAEFEEYAAKFPQFSIQYVIEPQKLSPELILEHAGSDRVVYVSGPEPMVEAFEARLKELGLPEERLKNDYFPGYTGV